MINKKTYIPLTKNNRIRAEGISKYKPSNFKTRDDLNKEISFIKKSNRQYKSFKIHGASFPLTEKAPVDFGSHGSNPEIDEIINPPPFTTKINVFFDDSGSMNSTLSPLQIMASNNLKEIILPYYNNDSAAYDENVNVITFSSVPGSILDNLNPNENSIVLGGSYMRESPSDRNVINIMFQDEANGGPTSIGSDNELSEYQSSVHFLTGGLKLNEKNRAFFFQVERNDAEGADYRTLLIGLSGSLENTPFANQTTFTLDVVEGDSPSTYANIIRDALSVANDDINESLPTATFAISASFITGNAQTSWATAWKFSTEGGEGVDRNGVLDPGGSTNPTLNFNMGDTIRFENLGINSFDPREEGRPFTIRNVSGVGTTDLAQGVVNNSSTSGSIFFTPVAPGTYYYNDSSDSSNGQGRNWGQIIINDIDSSFQYVNNSFESMFN